MDSNIADKPCTSRSALANMPPSAATSFELPSPVICASYFNFVKDIEKLVAENHTHVKCFYPTDTRQAALKDGTFTPLYRCLMDNAQLNANKLPKERRHDHVTKKISTSLFIYARPLAYYFVHQNMPQALSSLRTFQRIVHNEYEVINVLEL